MDYPKLRYGLEALPIQHEGKQLILLRDRLGYSADSLLFSPVFVKLLAQMDGKNSLRDLQAYYMRLTGEILFTENLEQILAKMDEHLFLENERFIQYVAQQIAHFQRDPIRHMQHAGKSYPEEPEALRRLLDGFFAPENGGPGKPQPQSDGRHLLALVAPHIDLKAGGATFAYAYKASREAVSPETWVVLGTGHEPIDHYFALTQKDFETPLGAVPFDREFCKTLLERSPRDLLAGEYNHHREHTIEFQAVFLAHLHPRAQIVPLLCSFSQEDWESDGAYIDQIAALLRETAQSNPRSVGFIASVDLAHIGPRYGDNFRPHAGTLSQHVTADQDLLKCLEKCDSQNFIRTLCKERNQRRICGMAPLYIMAKILEGQAQGEILHHAHAVVDAQDSFVTFASMAFYRKA